MSTKTTLYKKAKTGKIQVYISWTVLERLYSEYGELDGKMQLTSIVCVGKNIGRSNETTPEEQAVLEGISKCNLKRDKGYFDTVKEALTEEVFLPMLAKDGRKINIPYPCDAQPKLDGVRCMAPNMNLMSRGGKPYDVAHIKKELDLFDTHIPDGELYIHGMPLQDIVSLVRKPKLGSEKLEYWVYDLYIPGVIWTDRQYELVLYDTIVPDCIRIVPTTRVNNSIEMLKLHDEFVQEGYEGIILRTLDGVYELGHRSRNLIKYKEFMDNEFKIIGFQEGIGKFEGCVTWICETTDGKSFKAVPKGTLEMKRKWFKQATSIVGKDLTVRYQALTNDGIPQFPVGIIIRDYED